MPGCCTLPIVMRSYCPFIFVSPNVNLGIGAAKGNMPHLVGKHLLQEAGLAADSIAAHAFTLS